MNKFIPVIGTLAFMATSSVAMSQDVKDSVPSILLQEVLVFNDRPEIQVKEGVISINPVSIIKDKPVSTIYEALPYVPGIAKDASDNITLLGASGMNILINGKKPNMSLENVIALLQSYPIGRLKHVEIMYSTPSKYHVEGASINIVLKKVNLMDGLSGQIGGTFMQQHYTKGAAKVAASYAFGKCSADLLYNFVGGKSYTSHLINSQHSYRDNLYAISQKELGDSKRLSHNGHLGFEWDPAEGNKVSVSYNFQFNPSIYERNISTGSLGSYLTNKDYVSFPKTNNVNIDYESSFGLNAGGSYTNYMENENTTLTNIDSKQLLKDFCSSQDIQRLHFYIDQANQLRAWNINYGLSMDYSNDKSSQSFINQMENNMKYNLKEVSLDGYVGMERTFSNGLSLSVSLKADYYHRLGESKWWVAPQIALTYINSPKNIFQIDISTTKKYPRFWEIHGGETWLNNYMVLVGNPFLKPSYSYENQFVYIYRQKYMAVVYYNYTDDYFVQLPYQSKEDLRLIYQTNNYNYSQMGGIMLQIPVNIGKIYDASITLNGYWTRNKISDFHGMDCVSHKFSFYADMSNTLRLIRNYPIYLTVGGSVLTPSLQGIADLSAIWKIDAGIKWSFLNGNADLSMNFTDIFDSWNPRLSINCNDQNLKMETFDTARQFSVSFNFRFKGYKAKKIDIETSRFGINN